MLPQDEVVSVIIVTHNRKDMLEKAILSVKEQTIRTEIIVMDDASMDETEEMVRSQFPDIIYQRSPTILGPSIQRNKGSLLARSEVIFFIDDDVLLPDKDSFVKTLQDFDHPVIGAVAIPVVNILQDNVVRVAPPDKEGRYIVHAFIAAAFAIRSSLFFSIGGFHSSFFYMGEEGDLCIRLLQKGFLVKAGRSLPVHHYQQKGRVSFSADFYGRRNDIFFFYLHAPRRVLFFCMMGSIIKGLAFGIRVKRVRNMASGLAAGLKICLNGKYSSDRGMVDESVYNLFRYIKKHEPLKM